MGGHGGLNILPQKRWNVYNFDNREKVRKDEEAAALDEQQKREQSRRQDFEFRLQKLRHARNPNSHNPDLQVPDPPNPNPSSTSNNNHINLFEDFSSLAGESKAEGEDEGKKMKRKRKREERPEKRKEAVAVTPEDETLRLGYNLVGKGVKAPWYLAKKQGFCGDDEVRVSARGEKSQVKKEEAAKKKKKSIEELREERMRRERKEKERERALVRAEKGFSRRRM